MASSPGPAVLAALDADRPAVRRFVEHVMGMPISLALRGRHAADDAGRQAWAAVLAELRHVDRVFSTYRTDSVVSRLDRGELALEDCSAEVWEVFALGERARVESGGAFSVRLPVPGDPYGRSRIDPSGVVKGWAVERASRFLAALADTDYCLSAGGDVCCRAAPGREPWRIGVEDPADPRRVVAIAPLHDGAIATSGTARRGAHLIDARTGAPALRWASVTVVAGSLTQADIDATAACALGDDAVAWLRGRPIDYALLVAPDGRVEEVVPT